MRQSVTQEQEQKVQAELDLLKQKTGTEIEHLRLTAQQVFIYSWEFYFVWITFCLHF